MQPKTLSLNEHKHLK